MDKMWSEVSHSTSQNYASGIRDAKGLTKPQKGAMQGE